MWKEKEYLLITQSFPHSPQVFPQELSTASTVCGYAEKVHIKVIDPLRGISYFSGAVDFAMGKIFVRNSHLDKGMQPWEGESGREGGSGWEEGQKKTEKKT